MKHREAQTDDGTATERQLSYHVELPCEAELYSWQPGHSTYSVGTFAGRRADAEVPERMVQITIGREFACLTMVQLERLRMVLEFAAARSLADWPGAG